MVCACLWDDLMGITLCSVLGVCGGGGPAPSHTSCRLTEWGWYLLHLVEGLVAQGLNFCLAHSPCVSGANKARAMRRKHPRPKVMPHDTSLSPWRLQTAQLQVWALGVQAAPFCCPQWQGVRVAMGVRS